MSDNKPRGLPLLHKLLLALVVGLLSAEVGVRLIDWRAGRTLETYLPPADPNRALMGLHPFMGYLYRPGAERVGNVEAGGNVVHINSRGMRGPELATAKAPGTYRILCIGGSTTYGTGASGVMFVGEAPGYHEDREGVPFVGRAGLLAAVPVRLVLRPPSKERCHHDSRHHHEEDSRYSGSGRTLAQIPGSVIRDRRRDR